MRRVWPRRNFLLALSALAAWNLRVNVIWKFFASFLPFFFFILFAFPFFSIDNLWLIIRYLGVYIYIFFFSTIGYNYNSIENFEEFFLMWNVLETKKLSIFYIQKYVSMNPRGKDTTIMSFITISISITKFPVWSKHYIRTFVSLILRCVMQQPNSNFLRDCPREKLVFNFKEQARGTTWILFV